MGDEKQLAVVKVGNGFYGLDVQDIKEIVKCKEKTPIPHTPLYVEGLMNLRGQIVTVINLNQRFQELDLECNCSLEARKVSNERIVVINQLGELIGLHVDSVEQVLTLDKHNFEIPDASAINNNSIINSVIQIDNKLIMEINLDLLLKPLSEEGGE